MSAATYLNVPDKSKLKENPQMQNQVLYAPFVKAQDKVKRDVADLSLSDFQPKRFALNYDPPMIILEYLVPSTGKLYHHKMKLRRLTGESTVKECIKYLQKRHPLYFINNKIREDQITDLLQKLIYRVKQNNEMKGAQGKPAGIFSEKQEQQTKPGYNAIQSKFDKKPSIEQPESQFPPPVNFKAGNALPALEDDDNGSQFPGLGGSKQDLQKKANAMFDDLDLDDDFEQESEMDNSAVRKQKLKNEATADLAFEQESDSGEFNANELMDFSNYNNKRQQATTAAKQNPFDAKSKPSGGLNINDVLNEQKRNQMNNVEESDDWGNEDDWGEQQKEIHLSKKDMKNKNLNQLNNEELAAHKRAMDVQFNKNELKPGDPGFQYDKVVDFSKNKDEGPLEDDSWGEDDEVEENQPEDEEEYYYDEEEVLEDTQNIQQQQPQRASNLNDEFDDNDYFDDDFDDDFA